MHWFVTFFSMTQFCIGFLSLSVNGWWPLITEAFISYDPKSKTYMHHVIDTFGIVISSIYILFAFLRYVTIGWGIYWALDSDWIFEPFEFYSFFDWWKMITWTEGLILFTVGDKFWNDLWFATGHLEME